MRKVIPYLLLAILFLIALFVKKYAESTVKNNTSKSNGNHEAFRDEAAEYFFTKHTRCRMDCRNISQHEVKEIVHKANVNYTKSELDSPRGSKYALEGYTSKDNQHVRIIVALRNT